ncbi:transcription-repair coupling factor [Humisphaera borealis]|uniref:Transcription-repair-coupling factor n=1 Tax=Humisphaera borealis TaxID=2807512 RepID=A0A7M2X0G6_9BACT|nr:transcription-repair coupling factor [Humisphaera borealis]QOV91139.1 transcription-repair coupling factor [Humisphaera borealis]
MANPTPPAAIGRLVAARPLTELARLLIDKGAATASGLWGSSVAAVIAAMRAELRRPILLVCGHLDEADDLSDDIHLFTGVHPDALPALELGGSLGRVSEEQVSNRLQLLARYAGGIAQDAVIVAPVQALMQSVPSKDQLKHLIRTLKPGDDMEPEKLIVWLSDHGYNRLEQVEIPGDFAVRGGIIDVYLPGEHPESIEQVGLCARFDFFGDQIESIKTFDLDSLGSKAPLKEVKLLDLKGSLPDVGDSVSLFRYLPDETIVVLWAPLEIAEQSKAYQERLPDMKGIYPLNALLKQMQPFPRLELSQFDQGNVTLMGAGEVPRAALPIQSLQRFETEAKKAIRELAELTETHEVTVFCENEGEEKRFVELAEMEQPGIGKKMTVALGYLHRGFVWDEEGSREGTAAQRQPLALLGHHELFHRYEQRRRVKKSIASRPVDSFLDLKSGDYVVHVAHGIAKFVGMQTIAKDGKSEEYLSLRFADNATLHVPASKINLIQKYVGGFSGHPTLSRLGSGSWEKQKAKVADAVMDMAAELLDVQAARAAEVGHAFGPDTEWQQEFEAEFPYEPTQDQVTGNEEIKGDMMKRRPMDRLLCGDVGYGKTELAMRAAFKAAEFGKQVAVLVPTTVLAEQHYRSFRERMANYPFSIESISRFKSSKEAKDILTRAATGEVDILIGTHRLLSKDVKFADLGLVIVDEEQRFGVTHKERLKQMRKMVDVLTMSATPIPRTLHMSMLGLRDISSLTTAPQDRRSVVTEVMPFDRNRVKLAMLRELQREGQIYFVHNRVGDIIEFADNIQQMVPDARIVIGHGQMEEGEMEAAMMKFIRHEADILVSTTIIESGLDIPNANTIIIDNADRFGLSELHQLRGRVGRWKHRAYCYLLLPADRPVTQVASKRLKAIEEYSHLGAGFKIAMRDLELRGAGNILGPEQSGHIATVGYEMYCQLLEEATRQLKKEPRAARPEAHVELNVTAYIPKTYIPGDRQRMDIYRRLTRCESLEMLAELEKDVKDAFGEPPRQAVIFFALTEVRLLAQLFGIDSIIRQVPDIVLKVNDGTRASYAMTGAPGTLRVIDDKTIYLRMPPTFVEPEAALMVMKNLMRQAWDKEKKGEAAVVPGTAPEKPPEPVKKPVPAPAPVAAKPAATGKPGKAGKKSQPAEAPGLRPTETEFPPITPKQMADLEKLHSLREIGVLTDSEFELARARLLTRK